MSCMHAKRRGAWLVVRPELLSSCCSASVAEASQMRRTLTAPWCSWQAPRWRPRSLPPMRCTHDGRGLWQDWILGRRVCAHVLWMVTDQCSSGQHLLGVACGALAGVLAVAALPPVGCMDRTDGGYRLLNTTHKHSVCICGTPCRACHDTAARSSNVTFTLALCSRHRCNCEEDKVNQEGRSHSAKQPVCHAADAMPDLWRLQSAPWSRGPVEHLAWQPQRSKAARQVHGVADRLPEGDDSGQDPRCRDRRGRPAAQASSRSARSTQQ